MKFRTLHIDQLTAKDACSEQVDLFQSLFGEAVDISEAWALEHSAKFDWNWGARHLLSDASRAEYVRVAGLALAEYNRVVGPVWAEYERVTGPAWARLYVSEGAQS